MQDLAKLILENPVLVAVLTGLLTTLLVEAWKLIGKPGDDAKVEKALAAFVGAVVTAGLAQLVAVGEGPVNWQKVVVAILATWLASMGWYSAGKRLQPVKEAM